MSNGRRGERSREGGIIIQCVSTAADGTWGNFHSYGSAVSADGTDSATVTLIVEPPPPVVGVALIRIVVPGFRKFLAIDLLDSTSAPVGKATPDIIIDFKATQDDRIDLSLTEAIAGRDDDVFTFFGTAAFTDTAGELRFFKGVLQADSEGFADFEIAFLGVKALAATELLLT